MRGLKTNLMLSDCGPQGWNSCCTIPCLSLLEALPVSVTVKAVRSPLLLPSAAGPTLLPLPLALAPANAN